MTTPQLFIKSEERPFFAHHMLLHASDLAIKEAEATQVGQFNRCLSAMVMISLSVEALLNAVGSRVITDDWSSFERFRPYEKIDALVEKLGIDRDATQPPWPTLQYLGGFRNDIAHAKPELVVKQAVMPDAGLTKTMFKIPQSTLEREITLGNAKRTLEAVQTLKGLLTDALPVDSRFGIYSDMSIGSTTLHVPI